MELLQKIEVEELAKITFDLSIFSISNEARTMKLINDLKQNNCKIGRILLFGVRELNQNEEYLKYKQIFFDKYSSEIEHYCYSKSQNDTDFIKTIINIINRINGSKVKILIDYSVMPRNWFCKIPLVLKAFSNKNKNIQVYFSYTPMNYKIEHFPHIYINNFSSNCLQLGNIQDYKPKLVLLGLGFDFSGASALLQKIESEAIVFYTQPAFIKGMEKIVQNNNKELFKKYNSFTIPIDDLATSYDIMKRQYLMNREKYSIAIASLGPKPMTLVSSLLCLQYNEISDVNIQEEFISGDLSNNLIGDKVSIFRFEL